MAQKVDEKGAAGHPPLIRHDLLFAAALRLIVLLSQLLLFAWALAKAISGECTCGAAAHILSLLPWYLHPAGAHCS
jgi:hypothetical protein